jgi:hypothetical protein
VRYDTRKCLSFATVLVDHFHANCCCLDSVSTPDLADELRMRFPSVSLPQNHDDLLTVLFQDDYSSEVFSELNRKVVLPIHCKVCRKELKVRNVMDAHLRSVERRANWPNVIPDDTILGCCQDYYNATVWTSPPVCVACTRRHASRDHFDVFTEPNPQAPCNLELLRLTDPFIIRNCIVQRNSNEFLFDNIALDGLMLSREGVHRLPDGRSKVTLCGECHSALTRGKIARFSLKNDLYRGHLPDEFKDLTWVE